MRIDSTLSAVVTGGASGLGLATVKALRAGGARVAIFDRSEEQGEQAAGETGAIFCLCDVLSDESVEAAFARARAVQGQERALVCCAGGGNAIATARRDKEVAGKINIFPSDQFEWVLRLNTVGTFRCITRAAAGMMTQEPIDGERGVIVNTASAAATDGQMGQAAYAAAKAAIVGMTLPIARDLAREGIRVTTIQPGIFATPPMLRNPKLVEALGAMVPFPQRLGRPEEYASLALEMIRNGYFNGETVRLDGAIRMQPR